jgi:hypothetical protein
MTGNSANTVDTLAKLRIGVLAVEFLPWCAVALHASAAQCQHAHRSLGAPRAAC